MHADATPGPSITSRWLLERLGIVTTVIGAAPPSRDARTGRLVVANHLGFLDILVLAAWRPLVFVAKEEVADWPIVGPFARRCDTLFIPRRPVRRLDQCVATLTARLEEGRDVLVFPEATTSRGERVLPFRPACFEAACRAGADVECLHLSYRLATGADPTTLTTWVGDDWLLPRVAALSVAPRITAVVEQLAICTTRGGIHRKSMAREAERLIGAARQRVRAADLVAHPSIGYPPVDHPPLPT